MKKDFLREKPFYLNDEEIAWVQSTLDGMTQEEKIGQLFCVNIREGTVDELEEFYKIIP